MQFRIDPDVLFRHTLRLVMSATLVLPGCGTLRAPPLPSPLPAPVAPERRGERLAPAREGASPTLGLPAAGSGRGGYYLDDGPGEAPPAGLQSIPDAEPKLEPYSTRGNRPYVVFGKTYTPITDNTPLKQRGVGSWYGKKFHGQKTSSGELYDMYKMTAAHPTLPIPSYARVTNVRTGVQVIVRVNDRGPFHSSRIIDLSYTAALKLGYLAHGSTELEVERLLPDEIARMNGGARKSDTLAVRPPASLPPVLNPVLNPPVAGVSIDEFLKAQAGASSMAATPMATMAPSLLTTLPTTGMESALPVSIAAPAAVGETPPVLAPGGFYLQFGAFTQSANAEAVRQRLAQPWPSDVPALEVHQSGAVYRLYSGPFGSRADALAAARLLPENSAAKPVVVQR